MSRIKATIIYSSGTRREIKMENLGDVDMVTVVTGNGSYREAALAISSSCVSTEDPCGVLTGGVVRQRGYDAQVETISTIVKVGDKIRFSDIPQISIRGRAPAAGFGPFALLIRGK